MDKINFNERPDPFLAKLPENQNPITRIALVAIPFLSLYQPTRIGISLITSSLQVISLWRSDQTRHQKLLKSSVYTTMIVLSIYRPQATLAITLSVQTFNDIKEKKVYDIVSRMIYFYSIYSKRPECIVASLVLEAGKELKEAYSEYNNKHYLEVIAKLLMVALRCYQTKEEVSRIFRRYFGKTVTQENWDQLSKEENLSQALQERHYSDVIKDIQVKRLPMGEPSKLQLKGMVFERVDFSGLDLNKVTIENVTFNHCKMEDMLFDHVELIQVVWNHCQLKKGTFYHCVGKELTFNGCDLTQSCMSESLFSKLVIEASTLYGASFLNVFVKDSILKNCDLVSVLLCDANFMQIDCTKNHITKPVIALTWDFQARGSWGAPVPDVLEDQGALTLKFPIYPQDVDPTTLRVEVQKKLQSYSTYRLSRAQELLDDPTVTPEIQKIQKKAAQVLSYADGVILSGGENVETEFYSDSFDGYDHRRSLLEFAVIQLRKPVLGICRGCQVLNTYFGGTIKDVPYQWGRAVLDYYTNDSLGKQLKKKMQHAILGVSAHSQAADKMGQGLQILLTQQDIVKAFMNQDSSVIGTQFHPERYIDAKLIREEMRQADLASVIGLLAANFNENRFFQTNPLLTNSDMPQLSQEGAQAIIKYCNQEFQHMIHVAKQLQENQIFFKMFLDKVRINSGDAIPQRLEFAPVE